MGWSWAAPSWTRSPPVDSARPSGWCANAPRRSGPGTGAGVGAGAGAPHDRAAPRHDLQPRARDRWPAAARRGAARGPALDRPAARDRRHGRGRVPVTWGTGAPEQVLLLEPDGA